LPEIRFFGQWAGGIGEKSAGDLKKIVWIFKKAKVKRSEKPASTVDKRGLAVGLCRLGKTGKEKKV
jgi:hypothetical protein